jgi:hypothetical protein
MVHPAINLYHLLKEQGTADDSSNRKYITDLLCVGYGVIIANKNTHNIFNLFLK